MKISNSFILSMLLLFCTNTLCANIIERTLPETVSGVQKETISLNGRWQFQFTPADKWEEVTVPGELVMQGYGIKHDTPVLYKKKIKIPSDYKGKEIILRFDGVYSYARLWINGTLAAEHSGGFTRWETNITPLAKTGKENEITLEVTDKLNEISYASGYAHHPIGGILRDVTIYALPQSNMQNFYTETLFANDYKQSNLKISYNLTAKAEISFYLRDRKNNKIKFKAEGIKTEPGVNEHSFKIDYPQLWDAEHPNLYNLQVVVKSKSGNYSFTKEIGFRKIEIIKDQMFVNGKQVKLRGACRHDIHPTLGRTTNQELDSLDATLFKQANMNFVRTSHYPPTERFLKYCDRIGLYVECETAVCFVNTHRQKNYAPGNSQNDSTFTSQYLSQLNEMVATSRSHPSVLFWSIGNESQYGKNFQLCYDWLKNEDKTRPVIFSYPGLVEKGKNVYDILSMHYPGCEGTMWQYNVSTRGFQGEGKPALFDEWAHVPCYTYTTLQDDPNIREFWSISLDKMWSNLFKAPGGLGGAIWCYSDETFMIPDLKKGNPFWIEFAYTNKPKDFNGKCVGYGEWGIVDVWRREKPEFWGTKKAYSPIRILETTIQNFINGHSIALPVFNRFDHTNLKEVTAQITYKGIQYPVITPDLEPHQKGMINIPQQPWEQGEQFLLEFFNADGNLIDAEEITLGNTIIKTSKPENKHGKLRIEEQASHIVIKGDCFEIPFNKETGLMENVTSHGEILIEKGPFLNLDLNVNHLTGPEVREKANNYIVKDSDWEKKDFKYAISDEKAKIELTGSYLKIGITINMTIESNGNINISYQVKEEPNGWLREAGLKFHLADNYKELQWIRNGYWSYYPADNFASNNGKAPLYNTKQVKYGENPSQPWAMDTHNYYYFADKGTICKTPLTNKAKGMKEHIYLYQLISQKANKLNIYSEYGLLGCRMNKTSEDKLILYINNRWDYPEIAWGDFCKELEVTPVYGSIQIQL